ncbi:MAG TPA: phage holin family protein [Syntrophothermus lipocalidus]|uniref:Phage holin family protein n=1 Tax=Syntrophothermus lipocalidus (strain DSM 12680 / TGB-C1) TaxID=643648 RepID=D7CPI1_SYNLT|nr:MULTISPECIES: phage holin family protein [Syntrophothermus]ADI02616.1 membrane protein of unknown function [Syntrophothermus lipocalidus DSM 12680]NSW84114.1 phage holin family protein [Syntrophothermus sp.]HHV76158.1 phage holin family protein [Syntrophothermus lipocalidus]HOV43869.1 phage holin family protein [Syntrophothermus lipocalidus]
MRGWVVRWLANIIAIIITAAIVPGFEVTVTGAIIGSVFLGIVNAIIRPVIIVLTLPINILTLGLFTLVINGLMLWLTASVIKGFDVSGFWAAVLSALIISVVSAVLSWVVKDQHEQ